jgi:hypothetical protein
MAVVDAKIPMVSAVLHRHQFFEAVFLVGSWRKSENQQHVNVA